ncbi:MAG: type II toxin-antitoxin system VapC family toxin [Armatimonadetes bacterium]|nr:type II toxin-antitoxin system VapC family toxin [Armatimonadota bacterium]
MRYLLDTCAVSEFAKPRPNPGLIAWLQSQREADLCISVLTIGEIASGVERVADPVRRAAIQRWLATDLMARFAGRVLDVDSEVATIWGRVCATAAAEGYTLPAIDALLAATALAHGLSVVTRNDAHFARSGVHVLDPWS